MPTKRAILAELTANELRASIDFYELAVADRRVKPQLVDALARSRKARLYEILQDLSRERLKELCRTFDLDDSGRKKEGSRSLSYPTGRCVEEQHQGRARGNPFRGRGARTAE